MTVHRQLDDDLVHIRQSLLDLARRVEEMIAEDVIYYLEATDIRHLRTPGGSPIARMRFRER